MLAVRAAVVGALLFFILPSSMARAGVVAVVVEGASPADAPLVAAVRRAAGGHRVVVHDIRQFPRSDAIARGRYLARIAGADLVVPLGTGPSLFIAQELDEAKTFFVGGGMLPGEYLRQPNVAGILPFAPEEVVGIARSFRIGRRLGLLSTPGYENVVAEIRDAAARADLSVVERRISARREIGPAVRSIAGEADALWILGDPLLGSGAGLRFVIETALSLQKPVIGTTRRQVEAGALYCILPDAEALGAQADRGLRTILAADFRLPARRIEMGPVGGTVGLHRPLAERLGVRVPQGLRVEAVR